MAWSYFILSKKNPSIPNATTKKSVLKKKKSKYFYASPFVLSLSMLLYKSHTNILGLKTLISWAVILGWCPSGAGPWLGSQCLLLAQCCGFFPGAARMGSAWGRFWGGVGCLSKAAPAQPPCTCIIRAELKMAAGIWFPLPYFVSLGSAAVRGAAVECKWGCEMGLTTSFLGALQRETNFFPLALNAISCTKTLKKPRNHCSRPIWRWRCWGFACSTKEGSWHEIYLFYSSRHGRDDWHSAKWAVMST